MAELERLSVSIDERPSPGILYAASIDPDPDGELVRYEDVRAALEDEGTIRAAAMANAPDASRWEKKRDGYEADARIAIQAAINHVLPNQSGPPGEVAV